MGQIELPEGIPENLETVLRLDDPQTQLQMHSGSSDGMFHGQGSGENEQKVGHEDNANTMGRLAGRNMAGASEKGTWVRLLSEPVEGKLVQGVKDLNVGDQIKVQLKSVDVQ